MPNRLLKLMDSHRLVRRLLLAWAVLATTWVLTLITWVVHFTWTTPPEIPSTTVQALVAVLGLLTAVTGILTAVIGFYQWSRSQDDKHREVLARIEEKLKHMTNPLGD